MGNESNAKMTTSEALKFLRESWNRGIELSQENTAARIFQRIVIATAKGATNAGKNQKDKTKV